MPGRMGSGFARRAARRGQRLLNYRTLSKVLTDFIIRYLESNKRLVVPQLGAFVVKASDGCVLFTELFRRDDGVLRGLLCAGGMSELEAAGAVDRFVFEVRHAVQEGGEFVMEGFGTLRRGPEGTIVFVYKSAGRPQSASRVSAAEAEATGASGMVSAVGRATEGGRSAGAAAERETKPAHASDTSGAGPSVPSKLRPDPSVKGLRYGKPVKTTDAYAYVGSAPRRRVDKLILIAIAAAVLALAAIAYGYIRDLQTEREQEIYTEKTFLPIPSGTAAAPAETETQN